MTDLDRTTAPPRSASGRGRVPPHSNEAEESVLGAIMLSAEAANLVMDKLEPEDFYVPAHQAIFDAIVQLYNGNQPIDPLTVSDALHRKGELERVGGAGYLTDLMEGVPTASNIEYYAEIVEEHGLRRRLIGAGGQIGDLAVMTDLEISAVLDRAEQAVFGVGERRIGEGLMAMSPLLHSTLEVIEEMEARGSELTGLATGFRDLDRKLAGLQPANLVIVAARPSMGKCLAGNTRVVDPKTGALTTIREMVEDPGQQGLHHTLSLDIGSLKLAPSAPTNYADNGVRPTFRLTTRLGREIEATTNHPFLTVVGWRRLDQLRVGDAIAVPRAVDAFGVDDRPNAEVAMLGYLIGDGTLAGTTPRFTTKSTRILADVRKHASELGVELTNSSDSPTYRLKAKQRVSLREVAEAVGVSESTVSLVLRGSRGPSRDTADRVRATAAELGYERPHETPNPLTEMLEEHGLRGCGARTKFVPPAVFRLPKRQAALFLNRLYATDGSAWVSGDYYRIEYVTASRQLARDVQHLLLRFGIAAKVRERKVRYNDEHGIAYEVGFQDPAAVETFADQIGIFSKEEQLARVRARARSRRSATAFGELLPIEMWEVILAEKGDRSWADISSATGRPKNHNWHVNRRRPSRRIVAELAEALDSKVLRSFSDSEVIWDQVASITSAGSQRTYDLEVPGYENFVANDVVVHNSALASNIATNVAMTGGTVAMFSLEMSREEIVQRLLCSVGRVDSMKLRTGQLGPQLWQKVVHAASKMYKAPIFIDDSGQLTVTDIRAKCRRLKRQHGLDLVIIDYLQLMTGSARENRQQEIAEISRSLKNLARELDLPIVAVSQLNRSLEAREDKRPRLGDLRECLTGDTLVRRADSGATVAIAELAASGEKDIPVWSIDPDGKLVRSVMSEAWSTGKKAVYRITTASGRVLTASGNHPLLTIDGWLPVGALQSGDRIAVPRRLPTPDQTAPMDENELILLAHLVGDGSYVPRQPLRYTSDDPENHAAVVQSAKRRFGVEIKTSSLPDRSWQTRLVSPFRVARGRRNPVVQWLDDLGIYGQRSHEKHLPARVFSLPDDQVRLFLRHLWATDGSVTLRPDGSRCRIYYATSSRSLANDVNALLLRLGFQPRLKRIDQGRHRPSWNLDISGIEQQRRFLEEVGCHGRRRSVIPDALEALGGRVGNPNVDTVPVEVWDTVRTRMRESGLTHRAFAAELGISYPGTAMFGFAPSRERLSQVAGILDDERLRLLAEADVLWDAIETIEPAGDTEVFDARVPETHNFLAGDIVVHNSGAIEQDSDVVMFIYRHEYYHPEAQDTKGLAEVIIAKHRAGSTGRVDMTFLPEFTLFADLGRDVSV